MLTNQSEGARDWTNQRRVSVDQSERSSQNAMRGTDGIKGTVPSLLPFPSITQYRKDVNLCMKFRSLAKTRPSPLVVETEVTISRGAFWVHSTVAPPIVNHRGAPSIQHATVNNNNNNSIPIRV